jgi:hypothetical protein
MGSKTLLVSAVGSVVALVAGAAGAQDMNALARDQVGTPLATADAAAQGWTLETGGRAVCKIRLTAQPMGHGVFHADVPGQCAQTLPGGVAGWKPVTDGAALVDGQGQILIDFNRWSNSLLVSHRSSGVDIQLRRGS